MSLMLVFFFFNDTATTEIYTLSLHDALPICASSGRALPASSASSAARSTFPLEARGSASTNSTLGATPVWRVRSEEHTSELQSRLHLVCRLLLEKKKNYDDKAAQYYARISKN